MYKRQVSGNVDAIDEEPESIEEEKKVMKPRNLSNATDEEPINKTDLSSGSSSEEKPKDWNLSSSRQIPTISLRVDEESKERWIILEGDIKKWSVLFIFRKRHLVLYELDGVPKLEYYYAQKNKLRGIIPLTRKTVAKLVEPKKFEIHGGEDIL